MQTLKNYYACGVYDPPRRKEEWDIFHDDRQYVTYVVIGAGALGASLAEKLCRVAAQDYGCPVESIVTKVIKPHYNSVWIIDNTIDGEKTSKLGEILPQAINKCSRGSVDHFTACWMILDGPNSFLSNEQLRLREALRSRGHCVYLHALGSAASERALLLAMLPFLITATVAPYCFIGIDYQDILTDLAEPGPEGGILCVDYCHETPLDDLLRSARIPGFNIKSAIGLIIADPNYIEMDDWEKGARVFQNFTGDQETLILAMTKPPDESRQLMPNKTTISLAISWTGSKVG